MKMRLVATWNALAYAHGTEGSQVRCGRAVITSGAIAVEWVKYWNDGDGYRVREQ